jgi:hypothetical protein
MNPLYFFADLTPTLFTFDFNRVRLHARERLQDRLVGDRSPLDGNGVIEVVLTHLTDLRKDRTIDRDILLLLSYSYLSLFDCLWPANAPVSTPGDAYTHILNTIHKQTPRHILYISKFLSYLPAPASQPATETLKNLLYTAPAPPYGAAPWSAAAIAVFITLVWANILAAPSTTHASHV